MAPPARSGTSVLLRRSVRARGAGACAIQRNGLIGQGLASAGPLWLTFSRRRVASPVVTRHTKPVLFGPVFPYPVANAHAGHPAF